MEDINGKKMLAIDVFTMAIRYMREHIMNALKKQVSDIQQSDVLFVITVPAIWSDASKQFMREAAIAVGCLFGVLWFNDKNCVCQTTNTIMTFPKY